MFISHAITKILVPEGIPKVPAGMHEELYASDISINVEQEETPVESINRFQRSLGYTRGILRVTANLTIKHNASSKLNYPAIKRAGKTLQIFMKDKPDGDAHYLKDVRINDYEKSYDTEGNTQFTLSIKALDYLPA